MRGRPVLIRWHARHETVVWWSTRTRRSKRLRWALRAARRGRLEAAFAILIGDRRAAGAFWADSTEAAGDPGLPLT